MKPADNAYHLQAIREKHATPVTYADARNSCWKRRHYHLAKVADTPDPKREDACLAVFLGGPGLLRRASGAK
jgi:hypothetical protein